MFDTYEIYNELLKDFNDNEAKRLTKVLTNMFKELANVVTKDDFIKLEKRLNLFEKRMEELAEAQKRTEESVRKLAEAQRKTEEKVKELAEAQKRTEERVSSLEKKMEELAEAQRKTEEKVKELAEAQRKTEEVVRKLVVDMDEVKKRLEGISNSVGYSLENQAIKSLPKILKKFDIRVNRLMRKYVPIKDKIYQLNIYGEGKKNSKPILIIGEAKVRPSKKEILRFEKVIKLIQEIEKTEIFKVFIAHDFHPRIENYLKEKNILPIWSYEL